MRKVLALGVLFLGSALAAPAEAERPSGSLAEDAEVAAALALAEARLAAIAREQRIPGLSAGIVYDQELLWAKGFGYADVARQVPATPQTIYRVASITKVFTATMLMQLRDAGKVSLDDPVAKYVPEFHLASRFADSPAVTLVQLASHTSGMPREAPLDYWRTLKFPPVEEMVTAVARNGERAFPPYVEWKYSNVGYAILGYALARAAGQPYFDYVRQHILRPLGMTTSDFQPTPAVQARLATGYLKSEEGRPPEPIHQPDYGGYGPASSLYTSVEEIARFLSLQFRDAPAGGSQVLRGSSLREMHLPRWLEPDWQSGRGIGFRVERIGRWTAVGHGGGIQGFRTDISLIPSLKLGVAVFTNTMTDPDRFTRELLELLAPVVERAEARRQPPPPLARPEWQRYVGRYGNVFGEARIELREQRLWLVAADGSYRVELTPVAEHTFRMKGGWSSGELLRFELDAQGRITGLWAGSWPMERR